MKKKSLDCLRVITALTLTAVLGSPSFAITDESLNAKADIDRVMQRTPAAKVEIPPVRPASSNEETVPAAAGVLPSGNQAALQKVNPNVPNAACAQAAQDQGIETFRNTYKKVTIAGTLIGATAGAIIGKNPATAVAGALVGLAVGGLAGIAIGGYAQIKTQEAALDSCETGQ
ncbi:MAG: hypothetical protein HY547_02375 [Elusimicrobia bacterium]|nr:hypothetical protein [Elusimicrobiota bacterium]